MSELVERIAQVEAKHEAHVHLTDERFEAVSRRFKEEAATRLWVREELKPVAESVSELAGKIGEVVTIQKHADKRMEEFHATQNAAMEERRLNEKKESEARIAALERASFRYVVGQAWFRIMAVLAFPPIIWGTIEALKKLVALAQ